MGRRILYPPIEPYRISYLKVSDLHEICYEEAGNPHGRPVVFLHGGPGAGIVPIYRQIFDPARYRIVLPDQRGAGRSRPFGELRENTTWDLVGDLERLREHLGIARWMVVGGSWGGTLALAYAQAHPQSVSALILRGTWLARQRDVDWQIGASGAADLYPHEYDEFISYIPPAERSDIVGAYLRRLTSDDLTVATEAARNWGRWEGCKISLDPKADLAGRSFEDVAGDYLHMAKFEALYEHKRAWLKRDCQLLEHAPHRAYSGCRDLRPLRYDHTAGGIVGDRAALACGGAEARARNRSRILRARNHRRSCDGDRPFRKAIGAGEWLGRHPVMRCPRR